MARTESGLLVALLRGVYRALWWLVAPLAVLRLLLRSRREPGYRRHISERFGFGPKPAAHAYLAEHARPAVAPLIWIHAVSVGETRAAQPLIEALLAHEPAVRVLLTHMTPAGRATGETLFGARVLRCYLPYDMRGAVRRFLRRYQPAAGALIETEVWPTLIGECARAGMPLVLVNARMSPRSYRRAARFGVGAAAVFGGFARVFAQSAADAERLAALGAPAPAVLGNLKFDVAAAPELLALGHAWRRRFGARPVWVAASTRDGEEPLVLDALTRLLAGGCSDALLILVPRHPQRFDEVAALLERGGWRYGRRSALGSDQSIVVANQAPTDLARRLAPPAAPAVEPAALATCLQVWLGDSMGELAAYYAAADVAFIGGSLLPLGGQNLIEACAVGTPVLLGPHTFNFTQASLDAIEAGAALRVQDSADLARALLGLFDDPSRRDAMAAAARRFAASHTGATARTVTELLALVRQR